MHMSFILTVTRQLAIQVADIWRAQDLCGHTALNVAVQCGSKDVLEMVLGQISTAHDQLNDQVGSSQYHQAKIVRANLGLGWM